jgi:hypothetical protein
MTYKALGESQFRGVSVCDHVLLSLVLSARANTANARHQLSA